MGRFTIGVLEDVLQTDWGEVFPKARALGYDGVELGIRADNYRDSDLWGISQICHESCRISL